MNIVSLWRAFGFEELLEPEYGASLTIELHEEVEQDSFFIRVCSFLFKMINIEPS